MTEMFLGKASTIPAQNCIRGKDVLTQNSESKNVCAEKYPTQYLHRKNLLYLYV